MRVKSLFLLAISFITMGSMPVWSQCDTWNTSTIRNCNGIDYELWNQGNTGTATMKITGSSADPNGGTFEASWDGTINILARAGKKWGSSSTTTARSIGDISLDFAATWSSSDNVKMLGVYGWAYYPSGSVPTQTENGQNQNFSNQIEYYIIQDRGSYNPASGGTNAKKYGEGTVDGIAYEFWVADRINQAMLTGTGNFKQYFSVPKNTSSHRQSGVVSISKHFEAWENAGMKMLDCPLYEVAMKVESYTGSPNGKGSATVTKNLLTLGATTADKVNLTTSVSPSGAGVINKNPEGTSYDIDASVALTAVPNSGWEFVGWSGDASGTSSSTSITMSSNKNVVATFALIAGDDTTNLIKDGDFQSGSVISVDDGASWKLGQGQYWGNSEASASVSGGVATIDITTLGTQSYQPQLVQYGWALEEGMMYKLSFKAKADVARKIEASFQQASDPWAGYASKEFELSTSEQSYEYVFNMNNTSDPAAQFAFNMGQTMGKVYISEVRLVYTSDSITANTKDKIPTGIKNRALTSYLSHRTLFVSLEENAQFEVKLIDLQGSLQAKFKAEKSMALSLENLKAGSYYVLIKGEGIHENFPLILK